MLERYMTPKEVSARLRNAISVKTLQNWRCMPSNPGPPYRRFGNKILYPTSGFEEWERAQDSRCNSLSPDDAFSEAYWDKMLADEAAGANNAVRSGTSARKRAKDQ